jgi:hypothetical protein
MKKPRSSARASGVMSTTSGMSVGANFMVMAASGGHRSVEAPNYTLEELLGQLSEREDRHDRGLVKQGRFTV